MNFWVTFFFPLYGFHINLGCVCLSGVAIVVESIRSIRIIRWVCHDSLTMDLVLYIVIMTSFEESELLGCAQVDMIVVEINMSYWIV